MYIIDELRRSLQNEANANDQEWHAEYQAERQAFLIYQAGPFKDRPSRYSRSLQRFVPIEDAAG